jgi:hypothetical protein
LLRDNCHLAEYEAWFEGECDKLVLEPGFIAVGPFLSALGDPDAPPWDSDFGIIYPNGMYIRVAEYYRSLPKRCGGGGCLESFSYHYGPCTSVRDKEGFPRFSKKFELRIDVDRQYKRHIHYMGENHIPEARLPGLDFNSIDPFAFIRAVELHRKSSKPLHEILGFKVVPTI